MTDLAAWLLDAIAEDERVAQAATPGLWRYDPSKVNSVDGGEAVFAGPRGLSATTVASVGPCDDPQSMSDGRHIARWDPARVLAECAAKRRIVEEAEHYWAHAAEYASVATYRHVLRILALPYADRPGYLPEWTS